MRRPSHFYGPVIACEGSNKDMIFTCIAKYVIFIMQSHSQIKFSFRVCQRSTEIPVRWFFTATSLIHHPLREYYVRMIVSILMGQENWQNEHGNPTDSGIVDVLGDNCCRSDENLSSLYNATFL